MTTRTPAAGGFFLILAILAGFFIGAANGTVVVSTLIGTLVGIVLALIVWVIDRRRG